jgi:gliding motility-associated-like protein
LIPANAPLGSYVYRVVAAESANMSNVGCRVISSIVTIIVEPKPTTILSANTPLCSNSNLQISATSIATQYQWVGPGGFTSTQNPIVIPNAQTVNTGKYYALASTVAGCSYYDSISVTVNPVPIASVNIPAITICESDTVSLTSSGGNAYSWQPVINLSNASSAATFAFPSLSTNYNVIVSNAFNCTDTASVNITVIKKAKANAGPDLNTIVGIPVRLQATAAGDNITYAWTPPVYLDSPFVLQPWVDAPVGVHNYQLLVSSNAGCGFAPDNVKVTVYDKLYVPTAFTPNNDGKNDKWIIPALAVYPEAEVMVYNRYGEMIVKAVKNFAGWDGTYKGQQQLIGAYVYVIKLNDAGNTFLKGTVTIIR